MTVAPFDAAIAFAWDGPSHDSARATKARLLLADSLGCMMAGLGHDTPRALAQALSGWMPGGLHLPGVAQGLSAGAAAAVLAAAMCWDEANEGLARAHGRPGLAVAPLCVAALAEGRVTLGQALAAFALGYEVAGRAGEAWRIRPGMHVDGSWHALGAAAAAVRLAGGDQAAAERAVRLVACQVPFALYAPISAGMDGRNTYPGHAVLLGALAASGAMAGMDAPAGGFAEARHLALGLDTEAHVSPPGAWLIEEAYIKPFAGVRHAHYGAAAALDLGGTVAGRLDDIAEVSLATYAEALRYAGNRAPGSAISAQFSLSWGVAAALVQGDLGPAAYTASALADPRLRDIEARVRLVEDDALTRDGRRGATLTLLLRDGTRAEARVDGVPGDPGLPMTEPAVRAKFLRFAAPAIGASAAEAALLALLEGNADERPGGAILGHMQGRAQGGG